MKEIKLYYFDGMPNFGDMLNVEICKSLFNVKPLSSSPQSCEASFIGSLLDDFLYDKKSYFKYKFLKQKYLNKAVNIWGSGFIADKDKYIKKRIGKPEVFFRRAEVYAVRGKLSLNRLKNILGQNLEKTVIADPGLLAEKLINRKTCQKKYKIGIIPHHIEIHGYKNVVKNYMCQEGLLPNNLVLDVSCYSKIKKRLEGAVFIDMEANVVECLKRISECELIASSSLHGLIVADSLNIPNIRIVASDRLIGGNYKFDDYYSAYKCNRQKLFDLISASDEEVGNLQEIITNKYIQADEEVEIMKRKLLNSFPYKE